MMGHGANYSVTADDASAIIYPKTSQLTAISTRDYCTYPILNVSANSILNFHDHSECGPLVSSIAPPTTTTTTTTSNDTRLQLEEGGDTDVCGTTWSMTDPRLFTTSSSEENGDNVLMPRTDYLYYNYIHNHSATTTEGMGTAIHGITPCAKKNYYALVHSPTGDNVLSDMTSSENHGMLYFFTVDRNLVCGGFDVTDLLDIYYFNMESSDEKNDGDGRPFSTYLFNPPPTYLTYASRR